MDVISTGVWPRYTFSVVVFLVISIFISILLGGWVSSKADTYPPSFVLLSKAARDAKIKADKRIERDWILFGISLIASVITGIITNYIFAKYFGGVS